MTTKEFNTSSEIYKEMIKNITYSRMDIFDLKEQKEVLKEEKDFKKKNKLRNIFKMINDLKKEKELSDTKESSKLGKTEFRTQNISLKIKPSDNEFFIELAEKENLKKGTLIYEILLLGVEVYNKK